MKTSDLDRLFDESFQRANGTTGALSGAYATSPLAADHLLLKRSWDYFRHRMNALEEQWRKILESKDLEVKAMQKELDAAREREHGMEIEVKAFREFDLEYGRSKANDYLKFKKDTERLRTQWEEERESFLKIQGTLELRITELEAESLRAREEFLTKQTQWKEALESAKAQSAELIDRQKVHRDQWLAEEAKKAQDNTDLQLKIDLLRAEVENRDQVIKRLKEDIFTQEKQKSDLATQAAVSMGKIRELESQLSVLSERYDILSREKEAIREGWSKEQAEWRELWDRQRAMLEREKSRRDEDVDSK